MRCIAPFWRGLEDFNSEWTEYQLVAAGKGLPIPLPDQIPPELEAVHLADSKRPSTSNAGALGVPMGGRTDSAASDASAGHAKTLSSSDNTHTPSPFRPRSKTIASLTSKSPSQSDMVPREIQLPVDPYVNGLRMEAFLYKDAIECPICFIYYPPYLNQTRCCDQPICSECFVQIKRPDPHPPEHPDPTNSAPPEENPETLVSEPANCPYCQQAEFGVTYDPPPFRRGLAYANMNAQMATAMVASDSTPNNGSSSSLRPAGSRRRATSVSANASNVVTTDKIRPDWATKLANARNHASRRSAAATALHTAAYLMGNGSGLEGRAFGFGGRSRFGRTRDSPLESSTPTASGSDAQARLAAFSALAQQHQPDQRHRDGHAEGRRRSRMDDLEDMMMMEAIRLSIAAEEERKRKEEKETKKEAKRKEKEQKKVDKQAAKNDHKNGIYGGSGSRTASALSLVLPGRRRGNSGSSAMAREASNYSVEHTYPADNSTDKGKGVDRTAYASSSSHSHPSALDGSSQSYGHHLSVDESPQPTPNTSAPAAAGATPDRPSHLRQISSASSPSSSYIESAPGSIRRGQSGFQASQSSFESPSASNTDLGHRRDESRDTDNDPGSAGDEPMFNFRSLAEIVGREDEKDGYDANQVEYADESQRPSSKAGPSQESAKKPVEEEASDPFDDSEELMDQSIATLRADDYGRAGEQNGASSSNGGANALMDTPGLMVTPVTPALEKGESESKQLGH